MILYLGEDETFSGDAQNEGILAIGELAGTIGTLPRQVLFHQVDVIQRAVVEFRVGN